MSVRGFFLGLWLLCVALMTGPVTALVVNEASTQPKWPGQLDLLRRYPWPALAALAGLAIVAFVVERLFAGKRDDQSRPVTSADFSNAHIGTLNLASSGAEVVQTSSTTGLPTDVPGDALPEPEEDEAEGPPQQTQFHRAVTEQQVILYHVAPFLEDEGWEAETVDSISRAHPVTLPLQLKEANVDHPAVSAVVIVCSSAHHKALRPKITPKLRLLKERCPDAMLFFVAAGLANEPLSQEEGYRWLRQSAGYSQDDCRFLTCRGLESLRERLEADVRTHVALRINQAIADEGRKADEGEGGVRA